MEKSQLTEALSKLQTEMVQPKKSADNPFFKSKYADLTTCFDAVKPHLSKYGLAITQVVEFTGGSDVFLISTLRHVGGEVVTSNYPVRPLKSDPQSLGMAITYARRYALNALFGIAPEGEDDDGNAASQAPTQQQPKAKQPTSGDKAKEAADGYIARINDAKRIEEIDAVLSEVDSKGTLEKMFPELYKSVCEAATKRGEIIAMTGGV